MALTFADTHNMIAHLNKSDASEGFEQILDFLNASVINYALTVNPTIYVSCIKQFWSSVSVKTVNDVIQLQALIDRKKVIIEALHLDDAKSIDCLPNEEIFTELARMGYEKPSTKTSWNEFTSSMASAVICLATGMLVPQQAADDVDDVVVDDVIVDVVAHAAAEPTPPSPTPTTIPPPPQQEVTSTPPPSPHQSPVAPPSSPLQQPQPLQTTTISMDLLNNLLETCTALTRRGIIELIDADEDVTLEEVDTAKDVKVEKDADVQGRLEESQAQVYHVDLEHADKLMTEVVTYATIITAAPITAATITAAPSAARRTKGVVIRDPKETATPSTIVHSEPKSKDKGKEIMVQEPKPLKKQAQIEQDEAYARELEAEINKNINWYDVIERVKKKEKEYNVVLRYQALRRKPQTEAHAKKNKMVYLKNMVGFKMDFFKGMSYDDIRPIFEKYFNSNVAFLEKSKEELEEEESRTLKRKTESSKEKAAKKQKLDEEVEKMKKHLQIVPNDEDDVYAEATPLALKVPIVDYEIHIENNIIRADGTHQLFLSFLSLLRNFDREDLEMLWQILQDRFASSKPKNFSDDFLLTTLKAMFKKPDVEA
uniref:Xylulose kinase-1 n=1 Tax=Tanacetum cinerariifolium TaxID=118510 RepID=A0A6L2N0J2_TANCI|nr:hypothetical protein [Tanacetum cinerariifolium]